MEYYYSTEFEKNKIIINKREAIYYKDKKWNKGTNEFDTEQEAIEDIKKYLPEAKEKFEKIKNRLDNLKTELVFLFYRYVEIYNELQARNYNLNFDVSMLKEKLNNVSENLKKDYIPSKEEIKINANRLQEKFDKNPNFYTYYRKPIKTYEQKILM